MINYHQISRGQYKNVIFKLGTTTDVHVKYGDDWSLFLVFQLRLSSLSVFECSLSITLWRENYHKKMMIVWNIYYHISGKMYFSEYVHGQQRRTLLAVKAPQRSRAVWPPCGFCKLNKIYRRGENYLQRNFVFASSVKTTIRPEVSSALCRDERSGGGGRPWPPPSSSSLCPRASPPAGVLFVLGGFFYPQNNNSSFLHQSERSRFGCWDVSLD